MIYSYLIAIVLFVFLAGIFSGFEIAFVSTSHNKVLHRRLRKIFTNPARTLAVVLVATNFSLVISSVLLSNLLSMLGVSFVSLWVSLILSPFGLIFAEMLPKMIGAELKEKFVLYFYRTFKAGYFVFFPFVFIVEKIGSLANKAHKQYNAHLFNRDDLKIIADTLYSKGVIETLEKRAMEDVFSLSRKKIKDVYRPLEEAVYFSYYFPRQEVLEKARKYGYTRYPVFKKDKIIGYVNIFDIFYNEHKQWQDLIRNIPRVSYNMRVYEVFIEMLRHKDNIAVVIKGNKVAGIVTLFDLIEEVAESLSLPDNDN